MGKEIYHQGDCEPKKGDIPFRAQKSSVGERRKGNKPSISPRRNHGSAIVFHSPKEVDVLRKKSGNGSEILC